MRISFVRNSRLLRFCAIAVSLLAALLFAAQEEKPPTLPKTVTETAKKAMTDAADSIKNGSIPDSAKSAKKQDLTDTVNYEADNIAYDADNRILQLTGHAKVRYQKMQLIADTIVYTMGNNLFTATGRPLLVEDNDSTIGDFMVYNIKTKRGRVRTATTHIQDAYFTGQRIIKTSENELYVAQGEYTTCAHPDTPHYFFYGERIRLKPNDKIISKPVVLNIGNAPVFALPYFIFPVERNRKSGILTPVWGGNPSGGGYIDNIGYYWTPNDYFDLTTSARIREFSEYIAELSSQYAVRYSLNGGFSTRYVFNSDFMNSQRQWSLDYYHNQNITPDGLTTLAGRGNLVSTKSFYSSFSEDSSELREQYLTSNMALSKQFQEIKANGSVVWNRKHNLKDGHIESDMPSMNFSLSDRPLFPVPDVNDEISATTDKVDTTTHWYNSIYWGYGGRGIVRSDAYSEGDKPGFIRPGASNDLRISAPQKLFKYITITPNASANLATFYGYIDTAVKYSDSTHFDTIPYKTRDRSDTARYPGYSTLAIQDTISYATGKPDTIYTVIKRNPKPTVYAIRDTNRTAITNVVGWRAGVSMSTNLYGVFPLRVMNFMGIRHTFSPSISYDFLPKHDLDKAFFPIGISPEGAHDRRQNVSFSVGNLFEGKIAEGKSTPEEKPKEKKFTILRADLSTGYNFEAKERPWNDLNFSASTGYTILGIGYNASYWMYDNAGNLVLPILRQYSVNLKTGNFEARGKFWDGDRLLIDSLRKSDPIRDFNAGPQSWSISIVPAFSFSASRSRPGEIMVPSKQFNLAASANCGFTRNWTFSWSGNYSPALDQMVQNSINAHCDLECWDMRFQWRPEKLNPGYYFIINIKKIPEIKWEQRSRY